MSLPLRWANTVSNPVARKRAAPPAIHGVAPGEARIVASEWADLAKDCTDWTTSAGIPGKDLSCFGGPGGAESSNIRSPAGLEGIPAAFSPVAPPASPSVVRDDRRVAASEVRRVHRQRHTQRFGASLLGILLTSAAVRGAEVGSHPSEA